MNKLFEKSYIGKMKLKNRIVMGPMGTTGEADGHIISMQLIILLKVQREVPA